MVFISLLLSQVFLSVTKGHQSPLDMPVSFVNWTQLGLSGKREPQLGTRLCQADPQVSLRCFLGS